MNNKFFCFVTEEWGTLNCRKLITLDKDKITIRFLFQKIIYLKDVSRIIRWKEKKLIISYTNKGKERQIILSCIDNEDREQIIMYLASVQCVIANNDY